jgi:hypothetical protein
MSEVSVGTDLMQEYLDALTEEAKSILQQAKAVNRYLHKRPFYIV